MKIIVSPAKTQQNEKCLDLPFNEGLFKGKSQSLLHILHKFDKDEIGRVMTIKGDLLEETYKTIQGYDDQMSTHGILLYTGLVFKGLEDLTYSEGELAYLDQHVRILSAFYGVVHPFDEVKPYRLDMKMKVMEGGLYSYWKTDLTDHFKTDTIINLASSEFSKMIKQPMVTIEFKEEKEKSVYKMIGTYAKQARGKMLSWMIRNNIQTIEEIKKFNLMGYTFNEAASTEKTLLFTRK